MTTATFVPEVVVFNPVSLPSGGEQFTNQSNTDTLRTGADWGGGRLVAGVGGGSGRFGDLIISDNQVRNFYTSELPSELRIKLVRNIRGADQARFMFGNNALNILYKVPNNATALDIPIRTIVPNLVYAATGREVTLVMVDGRILLRDGKLLTADEAAVRQAAQFQASALAQRVAADPVHEGMALLEPMAAGML